MRVLLIKPPMVMCYDYYEIPLNLAYLASSLLAADQSVEIADIQLIGWEGLATVLQTSYDLIGTTTYSYSLLATRRICQMIRAASKDAIIVLGGPHASFAIPETFGQFPEADAILRGESEDNLVNLCRTLDAGRPLSECGSRVPSLILRDMNAPIRNADRPLQIDAVPLASEAFSLLDLPTAFQRNPYVPFLVSRGCAYRCTFCLTPYAWGDIRVRSWPGVENELHAYLSLGVQKVNFVDDTFSLLGDVKAPMLSFLRQNRLEWACETRLDRLGHDEAVTWRESGLSRLRVSIESIHPSSLSSIRKSMKVRDGQERVRMLTDLGIDVFVSFMIGIPGENVDHVRATMDFADTLRPAKSRFWAFCPLPGTPVYQDPSKYGVVDIMPREEYSPLVSHIQTAAMSNSEINMLLDEAHRRFH